MPSESPLHALVDAVEAAESLDAPGKKLGKAVRDAIPSGPVKDALSGTPLGHALHPLLTDVAIGALMSASVLDVLAPGDSDRAAERLLQVGIASAVPTAATGISDWADSEIADPRVRRVGLIHANANTVALLLYTASLRARRRGARGRGRMLALAGLGVMSAGGWLGGHLSYVRGVAVNQTAFDEGSDDWVAVADASDVPEGEATAVVAGDTPVLLVRHGADVHAIHDRCSHRGCPLSDGEVDGHTVTCGCHGSQFDLRDGTVVKGPATVAQPAFETRQTDGRVEVRLRETG